jgi:hypothetical protein
MFVGDGQHSPKAPFILSEFGGISFAGEGGKVSDSSRSVRPNAC